MQKKIDFNIEPFSIKNDAKISGMNSSLQCLLSIPNFIHFINNLSNQQKKATIIETFLNFMQNKHDSNNIKEYFQSKNESIDFQDPFDFTNIFIETIEKELKPNIEGLFSGIVSEIQECSNINCQNSLQNEKPFSLIELSFKQSLRILYVPYNFNESPILMSSTSNIKGDYIFIYENHNEFEIIEDLSDYPKYSNIYAFEIPKIRKDFGFTIIQLNSKTENPITAPFLCEVPLKKIKKNKDLKDFITKKIKCEEDFEIQMEDDDLEFTDYELNSKSCKVCLKSIQVIVSEQDKNDINREPEIEDETNCNLKEMFDSYISISKLDKQKKCLKCKMKDYPYFRKKLTKFPRILIFRVIKSENRDRNHEQISIPEYFSLDAANYNKMNILSDPKMCKDVEGIANFELCAVSHQYVSSNNIKTYSEVKRGNKWYKITDTEVKNKNEFSDDYSNTACMLFYEMIIDHTKQDDDADEDDKEQYQKPTQKKNNKQIVFYMQDQIRKSVTIDKNIITNATEVIDFFREKYDGDEVIGFKVNGNSFFEGNETPINDILPSEKKNYPLIEIILKNEEKPKPIQKPVTNPPPRVQAKPVVSSGRPLNRPIIQNPPLSSSKCLSLAAIDYSSSMIACFKNTGLRRSKVAVETVNRFLQAGQLYCNEDTFKFANIVNINVNEVDRTKYNADNFKVPSELQICLQLIKEKMKKKAGFQYKRILLVTDGVVTPSSKEGEEEEDIIEDDDESFNGIFKDLIENQIILDVVLLKHDSQMAKDLCAVSHLSGGYYCCPESLNDLYDFIEDEKIVDLHQRRLLRPSSFNEDIFMNISKKIALLTKRKTNKYTGFYKEDIVLGLPSRKYKELDDTGNEIQSRIEKEIDICAYLQKGKKQSFAVYRVQNQNFEIDKRKIVLFLKSKNGVILQFFVFFPEAYPSESPVFRLISQVNMTNKLIPRYNFKVQEDEYSKETHLKDLISELDDLLQSSEVEKDLTDVKSPIESFDQIDCKFHINYGEGDKSLDYVKKFAK